MTWYCINLGNKEIDLLNDLFRSSPFLLQKNEPNNEYRVYAEERNTIQPFCMISYSRKNMAVYPAMIERLPISVQADIKEKLQQVNGLEKVVSDLVNSPSSA